MNDRTQRRRTGHELARRRRWPAIATGSAALMAALVMGVSSCTSDGAANPGGPGTAPTSGQSAPTARPSGSASTGTATPGKKTAPSKPATSDKASAAPPPVKPSGNVKQTSTTHKVRVEPRVPLKSPGRFDDKVTVRLTKVRPVQAKPVGPGEVGGSAVAVTVKMSNGSKEPINLVTVSVTMLASDKSPALMTTGGAADPLAGVLASGDSAEGTYVFTIAKKLRKPVTVQVQYGAGRTVLQFSGNAA